MHFEPSIVSRLNPLLFPSNHQVRFINYHNMYDDRFSNKGVGIPSSVLIQQIQWLKRNGFSFISAKEALKIFKSGKDLYRCIVFTTDDAHIDNWNVMSPIFDQYAIKPILFINSGNIGKPNYMHEGHIIDLLSRGYEFGSHTVTHINCSHINDSLFDREIAQDIDNLHSLFHEPVRYFAFPYGKVFNDNEYLQKLSNEGIEMSLSVRYMFQNKQNPLFWGRDKGEMPFKKFLFSFQVRPFIMSITNYFLHFDERRKTLLGGDREGEGTAGV